MLLFRLQELIFYYYFNIIILLFNYYTLTRCVTLQFIMFDKQFKKYFLFYHFRVSFQLLIVSSICFCFQVRLPQKSFIVFSVKNVTNFSWVDILIFSTNRKNCYKRFFLRRIKVLNRSFVTPCHMWHNSLGS